MNNINVKEKLGQIVARYPYTADVLNKYKIDYTFRGDTTLEKAIEEKGLNADQVVDEIDLAVDEYAVIKPDVIYWENEPIDKILDHIEKKHHSFMDLTFSELSSLFEEAPETEEIGELKELFNRLKKDMLEHQAKEERQLFPALREYSSKRTKELREKAIAFLTSTEDEHDEAGRLFKKINEVTNDFSVDSHTPDFMRKIYKKLDDLEKDAFLHIHMENSILFKMI